MSALALVLSASACKALQTSPEEGEARPVPPFLSPLITRDRPYPTLLQKQFMAVEATHSRLRKLTRSEKGRRLADECLNGIAVETKRRLQGKAYREGLVAYTPACAYYRMLFTGLYYQAKVVGYQKGLHSMIQDATLVLESDPSFEEGGVYRVLGNIYLSIPSFSFSSDAVLKDIDKAREYAHRALEIAPQNPENLLLMGKVLWEKKEYEQAFDYFKKSLKQLPRNGAYLKRERELMKEDKDYLEKERVK